MAKQIMPLGENVLVEPKKSEAQTASGIVLPESAEEKSQEGTVIAIGESDKIKVKVSDTVIYSKYSGSELKLEDKEYLLVKNEDILAVIK
jgi:chaperonin GroES